MSIIFRRFARFYLTTFCTHLRSQSRSLIRGHMSRRRTNAATRSVYRRATASFASCFVAIKCHKFARGPHDVFVGAREATLQLSSLRDELVYIDRRRALRYTCSNSNRTPSVSLSLSSWIMSGTHELARYLRLQSGALCVRVSRLYRITAGVLEFIARILVQRFHV